MKLNHSWIRDARKARVLRNALFHATRESRKARWPLHYNQKLGYLLELGTTKQSVDKNRIRDNFGFMTSKDAQIDLQSVIFLAGHFDELLLSRSMFDQLDGVLELLDFANSYVLSDRVGIGGAPLLGVGPISRFLENLANESQAVELIGHGERYQFDLFPFEDRPKMASLNQRLKELDAQDQRYSKEGSRCFDEVNLLEARAYILLADAKDAAYVPDRMFGVRAIEQYPEVLLQSEHLQNHEEFRLKLLEQLRSGPNDHSVITQVPSFLLEASHQAQTWEGIFAALTDMRFSDAARKYRGLVRVSRSPDAKERLEARTELTRNSQSAFKREGLPSGLNRWIVPTVGLSAAAIAVMFPAAGPAAGVVAAVTPLMDAIRSWQRERTNLFEIYNNSIGIDLYDELSRLFPDIKFRRENLAHFLAKRDFGWSEDLSFWRDVRSQANLDATP